MFQVKAVKWPRPHLIQFSYALSHVFQFSEEYMTMYSWMQFDLIGNTSADHINSQIHGV